MFSRWLPVGPVTVWGQILNGLAIRRSSAFCPFSRARLPETRGSLFSWIAFDPSFPTCLERYQGKGTKPRHWSNDDYALLPLFPQPSRASAGQLEVLYMPSLDHDPSSGQWPAQSATGQRPIDIWAWQAQSHKYRA